MHKQTNERANERTNKQTNEQTNKRASDKQNCRRLPAAGEFQPTLAYANTFKCARVNHQAVLNWFALLGLLSLPDVEVACHENGHARCC